MIQPRRVFFPEIALRDSQIVAKGGQYDALHIRYPPMIEIVCDFLAAGAVTQQRYMPVTFSTGKFNRGIDITEAIAECFIRHTSLASAIIEAEHVHTIRRSETKPGFFKFRFVKVAAHSMDKKQYVAVFLFSRTPYSVQILAFRSGKRQGYQVAWNCFAPGFHETTSRMTATSVRI
jgi:hypothetical protein